VVQEIRVWKGGSKTLTIRQGGGNFFWNNPITKIVKIKSRENNKKMKTKKKQQGTHQQVYNTHQHTMTVTPVCWLEPPAFTSKV